MKTLGSARSLLKHRSLIVALSLSFFGLILILLAQSFHKEWGKIELDRLLAEIGALFFIVFVLHWLFELGLREEMLRDVSSTVSGSALLHDSGVESCNINSRLVEERVHWSHCPDLIIGRLYSTRFLKDFHEVFQTRNVAGLKTTIIVIAPDGSSARYLQDEGLAPESIRASLQETKNIVEALNGGKRRPPTKLLTYDRVLRYSFIYTSEHIWIIFYTNNPGRANVPAFKIRAGSPLFQFFERDIKGLMEQSREAV